MCLSVVETLPSWHKPYGLDQVVSMLVTPVLPLTTALLFTSIVIDPFVAANKYIVVTGNLSLYGTAPSTVWTKLTAKAAAGATSITVASTSGWAVGDELGIAPSFNNSN
jgi:hypothetical protein